MTDPIRDAALGEAIRELRRQARRLRDDAVAFGKQVRGHVKDVHAYEDNMSDTRDDLEMFEQDLAGTTGRLRGCSRSLEARLTRLVGPRG